jgi:hypothetical protein
MSAGRRSRIRSTKNGTFCGKAFEIWSFDQAACDTPAKNRNVVHSQIISQDEDDVWGGAGQPSSLSLQALLTSPRLGLEGSVRLERKQCSAQDHWQAD